MKGNKMKYEYCGISLGDDIKDIINKSFLKNIMYRKNFIITQIGK